MYWDTLILYQIKKIDMDREFTLNRPKGKENIKLKSKIKNMVGMSIF